MLDFPCLGWRSCLSSRPLLHGWQLANKVLFHHHCVYRTLHFVWPAHLKKQRNMMEITQNNTKLSQEITQLTRLRMFWMALLMVMSLGTVAWAESPYFKLLGVPWISTTTRLYWSTVVEPGSYGYCLVMWCVYVFMCTYIYSICTRMFMLIYIYTYQCVCVCTSYWQILISDSFWSVFVEH